MPASPAPCTGCGNTRTVAARLSAGPLCSTCYRKHPASFQPCTECGTTERLYHHGLCTRCAWPPAPSRPGCPTITVAFTHVAYLWVLRVLDRLRAVHQIQAHTDGQRGSGPSRAGRRLRRDASAGWQLREKLDALAEDGMVHRLEDASRACSLARYRNRQSVYQFSELGYRADCHGSRRHGPLGGDPTTPTQYAPKKAS